MFGVSFYEAGAGRSPVLDWGGVLEGVGESLQAFDLTRKVDEYHRSAKQDLGLKDARAGSYGASGRISAWGPSCATAARRS